MGRFVFKLPDVGEGIAEAEVVAWRVAVGDQVVEDQPLADVLTDKATVELSSPVSGVVVSRNGEEGERLAIGAELVVLETPDTPSGEPHPRETKPPPAPAATPAPPPASAAPAPVPQRPGKALAAPAVRARAEALGLDLATVRGTGEGGRVTHADLDALLTAGRVPAQAYVKRDGVLDVRVVGLRRRIAERMAEAKRRIPHFSYIEEIDVTELTALREHLNHAGHASAAPLTLVPFLLRALVCVLPEWPQINATFDDEAGIVHRQAAIHIGLATQTPEGLMVPVIRHAEAFDLWALAREVKRLADGARGGALAREEMTGSTITLTSLGRLGGIAATPVINWPEVAIVGPNRVVDRPVVLGGQVVTRKMMNLSSSFDHRVVDGHDAASFIQQIKGLLEHPASLFVG